MTYNSDAKVEARCAVSQKAIDDLSLIGVVRISHEMQNDVH
ncbi:hypothetical protein pah_c188o038 [Parachlamydia acanthamoebae str. Hall's coccus]|nr:hypothetical protein pah_c188o038 [Parachlamydia acanthamoebae str. Hall's coccus]